MFREIVTIDFVCALSRYREVAYTSLGLPTSTAETIEVAIQDRSSVIAHGQIALVD